MHSNFNHCNDMYLSLKLYFLIIYTCVSVTYALTTFHDDYVNFPELGVSYKFHKQALTWGNARLSCLKQNATLAIPKDINEFNAIMQIFLSYPGSEIIGSSTTDYMMLGFNDYFMEQVFVTESGHSLDYFYKRFYAGEGSSNRGENAGGLFRNKGYADIPNSWVLAYICQKEDTSYADELKSYLRMNSDPNYTFFPGSNKKYKLHIDIKPWGFAQAMCRAEGGHLAIIRNKEEGNFLLEMMNLPKNRLNYGVNQKAVFVGYHDFYVDGRFITVKGENYEDVRYPNWNTGEPNGGIGENCAIFDEIGNLKDNNCDVSLRYICEIDTLTHEDSYIHRIN